MMTKKQKAWMFNHNVRGMRLVNAFGGVFYLVMPKRYKGRPLYRSNDSMFKINNK